MKQLVFLFIAVQQHLFNGQRKELVIVCRAVQQAPVICYLFPAKRIEILQCNARYVLSPQC
ncbi:hypothetical protein, partial [Staphylococcus aureus]